MKIKNEKLAARLIALVLCAAPMLAQELKVPESATAGEGASISTTGSGSATLIITGPGTAIKRSVQRGESTSFSGDELAYAGRYTAILQSGSDTTARSFYVGAGKPGKLNFMARPSRVPVAHPDVISGVVFVLDRNDNLVTTPTPVNFQLGVNGSAATSRPVTSKNGVAWIKAASGKQEGPAQFTASVGDVSARRVVQQVASDPCNLRMKVRAEGSSLQLETEPIKDCSGNPVPDGTIVTFSETAGDRGRSTVDARVKHGIAKATLPANRGATLSVASGVVLGNEIRWRGGE
jgi:hypothetical protein